MVKKVPVVQKTKVESLGQEEPLGRSLVGYGPWGHKELDRTE